MASAPITSSGLAYTDQTVRFEKFKPKNDNVIDSIATPVMQESFTLAHIMSPQKLDRHNWDAQLKRCKIKSKNVPQTTGLSINYRIKAVSVMITVIKKLIPLNLEQVFNALLRGRFHE